jgi:hypothetical protein
MLPLPGCLVEMHVEVAANEASLALGSDPLVAARVGIGALED